MAGQHNRLNSFLWIIAPAIVICSVYLATLTLPFDFVDDGCLVYPTPSGTAAEWLQKTCHDTIWEFHSRGPFRPMSWAHWDGQANLFGPTPMYHRLWRFAWAVLSASLFLWLLREFQIPRWAAILTTAAAMWNPVRGEIWIGLGLTEAFGMPYALLALICAVKAGRGDRPWPWDLLGLIAMLAALACKNTFAVVVPVQMLLRLAVAGLPWREAWSRHGTRTAFLGVTLLLPVIHFIAYRLDTRPKEYALSPVTLAHALDILRNVVRSAGDFYLVPALLLLLLALWKKRTSPTPAAAEPGNSAPTLPHIPVRVLLTAAMLLLILGIGIYMPIRGTTGRYTIPAVWGADLILALFLATVLARPINVWHRAGLTAFALGLTVALTLNLARLDKYHAKATLLWQALEYVELNSPSRGEVVFFGEKTSPRFAELAWSEGVHFTWHLHNRGREDLVVVNAAPDQAVSAKARQLALTSSQAVPPGGPWRRVQTFDSSYLLGRSRFQCHVWISAAE